MGNRLGPTALMILATLGLSALARPGGGQTAPVAGSSSAPAGRAGERSTADPTDPTPVRTAVEKLRVEVERMGGTLGVMVLDVGSGETLAASGEHAPLNPASNAKLITAAVALRRLGGSRRFLTGLYGKPEGDRVPELVLRGEGDPSLSTADLGARARELRSAGVRRVGSIAIDQSAFDDRYEPPAYDQQPNEWAPFRAPVAPVSLNENTVTFVVRPSKAGNEATVLVDPPGFVDVTGIVKTTAKKDPEGLTLGLEGRAARLSAKLGGHVPEGERVMRVVRRVADPRLLAGYALRAVLEESRVDVAGDVHVGGAAQRRLLAAHRSAPLAELLSSLGKESDNFFAEMIWKSLAATDKAKPASAEASAELAIAYLREIGAAEAGVVAKNGSGLFDANRSTAWSTTQLLRAAYRDPAIAPEFVAQLSVGGVDGTLKSRLRSWAPQRAVRAKTGTLDAVAALSGYVLAPGGRPPIAFAIFINGISGKVGAARPAMDKVVDAIATELWHGAR